MKLCTIVKFPQECNKKVQPSCKLPKKNKNMSERQFKHRHVTCISKENTQEPFLYLVWLQKPLCGSFNFSRSVRWGNNWELFHEAVIDGHVGLDSEHLKTPQWNGSPRHKPQEFVISWGMIEAPKNQCWQMTSEVLRQYDQPAEIHIYT